MIGPDRTAERLDFAQRALSRGLTTRAQWWEAGAGPSALWPEIHGLLRELREQRRGGAGTLGDLRGERWRQLDLPGKTPLASRHAYLVLARELGAAPAELFFVLFERAGHWDRRPGDPGIGQTQSEPI